VRVEFDNGTLVVSGRRALSFPGRGAVVVDIVLPSGSRLNASAASADIAADGRFADCKFATASGDLDIGQITGHLHADTASGSVTVAHVNGSAMVATASGDVAIGELHGDVKLRAASGSLTVGRLSGDLHVQTASGDVGVAAAVNGGVSVHTGSGDVVVGIAEGTAARMDVRTGSGEVRNLLTPSDGPAEGDETLAVHARTASGDVVVRRAGVDAVS
jgi:DUF4097 and DUF4098 domain-containing protein YvlB